MTSYQKILRQFQKQGIYEDSEMTEHEIKRVLDQITFANTGNAEFDQEVSHQIWNETVQKNVGGPVKLREFIHTMVHAENILREQVQNTQTQIRTETSQRNKQQLMNNLFSFTQDHRTISSPFNLLPINDTKQVRQSSHLAQSMRQSSKLFTYDVDQREQSTDLKVAFVLTLLLLFLELTLMFHKNHFFTVLSLFMILCTYFLNYFEKRYVIYLMAALGMSILLDIIWVIVHAGQYWSPSQHSHHSNIQTGFLRFIIFMIFAEIGIKGILIAIFFKYREVGEHVKKQVNIFGLSFHLEAQIDPYNLILAIQKSDKPFQRL